MAVSIQVSPCIMHDHSCPISGKVPPAGDIPHLGGEQKICRHLHLGQSLSRTELQQNYTLQQKFRVRTKPTKAHDTRYSKRVACPSPVRKIPNFTESPALVRSLFQFTVNFIRILTCDVPRSLFLVSQTKREQLNNLISTITRYDLKHKSSSMPELQQIPARHAILLSSWSNVSKNKTEGNVMSSYISKTTF